MANNQWNSIVGRTIIACTHVWMKWAVFATNERMNEWTCVRAKKSVLFSCMCNPISAGWRHLNKRFYSDCMRRIISWGTVTQWNYRLSFNWFITGALNGCRWILYRYFCSFFSYSIDELLVWFTCFLVQSVSSPVLVLNHYSHHKYCVQCVHTREHKYNAIHIAVYIWLR